MRAIRSIDMDRATSTVSFTTSDGKVISEHWEFPVNASSSLVRSSYLPNESWLSLETDQGDTVVADLPLLSDSAPIDGRPVIYLDQKDWSVLANTLHDPTRVQSEKELAAAKSLIELARAKKIILPMSSAHMTETSKWNDSRRRYLLARTIAELSHGWQMRHPTEIRTFEIQQSLLAKAGLSPLPALDVFTLAPCAALDIEGSTNSDESEDDLPPELALAVKALTCMTVYYDAILSHDAVPANPTPDWVTGNQAITDELASSNAPTSQKRKIIVGRLYKDLELEVGLAAERLTVSPHELENWRDAYFNSEIKKMTSLGLFGEVYQAKHLNSGTRWVGNDLIDMMFLSCAAGYADFVVGERSLIKYATKAGERLNRSVALFPRISDLTSALAQKNL